MLLVTLMNGWAFLVCAGLGFLVSLTSIPLIQRLSARWVAEGNETRFHHTHKTPVCRLGGIALAAAFVVIVLVIFFWFPVNEERTHARLLIVCTSLAMFLVGLLDDLRPLGAKKKLLAQILIAMVVCYGGVRIETFKNPFTAEIYQLGYWGYVATVVWLVALTNMINLIDGIDGLAAGIGLMMMGLLAYVGSGGGLFFPILVAAGMVGALLGFLRYNFPPAKIYLGDGGAYFIGFLIAILTLVNSQKGTILAALIAPLFALALPILDVSIAILRRGLKGLPIFRADRKHLHHRLQETGLSRTRTVLVLYGFSAVCLLMAFGVFWSQGRWVPILFGFLCLLLILSARSFNFSRDWFAVGRVLENSLELRKETHYALALSRWLEMEAERTDDFDSLWEDFAFAIKKMGFTGVSLHTSEMTRYWKSDASVSTDLRLRHELNLADGVTLEFTADGRQMSERLFAHLSELAAEAWLKTFSRWRASAEPGIPVLATS